MIKRMTLLDPRQDRTVEQFSEHWLTTHADIVRRMPAVGGYVQNFIVERLMGNLNPANPYSFAGIVELWFDDEDAQAKAFAVPAAKELPVDEPNFIRGITIYGVDEHKIASEPFAIKVMLVARSAADADESQEQSATIKEVVAALPEGHVVTANKLGKAGWRENIWHEPSPPDMVIELGFNDVPEVKAFSESKALSDLHATITGRGGAVECYRVEPRLII